MTTDYTYLSNPQLKIVRPGWPGNKVIRGMFANGEELYIPKMSNVWKWKFSPNHQKAEKERDDYRPQVVFDANQFSGKEDCIVWLGHSSFLLRFEGKTFLVDPVLYDLPLLKRRTPLPCRPDSMPPVDYLLLSHGHRDHLDARSVRQVVARNPGLKAFGPLGMEKLLHQITRGLPFQQAGWYQQFLLDAGSDLELFFLPAAHWHRRGLWDMNKVLWGSFLLKTKDKSLFFAGDTAMGPHFADIKTLFGPPDICLLPVGAYKPAFLMQQSHLSPLEAVEAFNLLGGKRFIPMHFGTFDLSDEPPGEPVRQLEEMAAAGKIKGRLVLPVIGANLLL